MDFSSFSLTLFVADSSFIVKSLVILPCLLFSTLFISCVAKRRTHANVPDAGFDSKQNTTGPTGASTKSGMVPVTPATASNGKTGENLPAKQVPSNQPPKPANANVENKQNVPPQPPQPQKPPEKPEVKKDEQIKADPKEAPKVEAPSVSKEPVVAAIGKNCSNPAKISAGKARKKSRSQKEVKTGVMMYAPEMDVDEDEETLQNVKSLEKDLEPSNNDKQ
uniref:Uncharacterized protein n=1 Tax=Panagrolaimus sp. JU765 TaxID=591449 RepID=A0AC34PZE6_9BILA